MSVERIKLSAGVWLLLSLLTGVLAGIGISKITAKEVSVDNPTYIPGRVVNIIIDPSQQEELFAQLQKFADKWGYAIRIAPVFQGSDEFHIGLWRIDMKATGAYSVEDGELQIAFTDTESTRPTPAQYFEEEIQDLKNFIGEIPNATFTLWTPPSPPN